MRTKLSRRRLPSYTEKEELFNTLTHVIGILFGIFVLVSCVLISLRAQDKYALVSSIVYGVSMILLYTMSSIYHGLPYRFDKAKKIFRIMDHCVIFIFIAGTYTPILLCGIRPISSVWAWIIFGVVWGFALFGIILNSIDIQSFAKISMVIYLGLGWAVIVKFNLLIESLGRKRIIFLVAGGLAYTVGTYFYRLQKKHRYMHGVWHLWILLASILHYICIVDKLREIELQALL